MVSFWWTVELTALKCVWFVKLQQKKAKMLDALDSNHDRQRQMNRYDYKRLIDDRYVSHVRSYRDILTIVGRGIKIINLFSFQPCQIESFLGMKHRQFFFYRCKKVTAQFVKLNSIVLNVLQSVFFLFFVNKKFSIILLFRKKNTKEQKWDGWKLSSYLVEQVCKILVSIGRPVPSI